ncbi:hypothetical protein DFR70_103680 [Nocardia tenerifensis]|uniref:Uncharacterized protein n=1 Tax=Nocardia tenerifensis TaxID=228006 RepID=A0A318KAU8_9NOCA|nr:hypothetical protein [Nocardia tenerifensis]PXX66925.1 hypothetical protein DFR70_103680 [Nocardia tenerifensis]
MNAQPAQPNPAGKTCGRCDRVKPPLRRGLCGACYQRTRERNRAYGRWDPDRAAADPVREHVTQLEKAGLSHRRLVELAELNRSTLAALLHGRPGLHPPQWISRAVADRILAVQVPQSAVEVAAPNAVVAVLGAQRRLRALVADGWPQAVLADELGMARNNLGPLMHGEHPITARRHRAVAELFTRKQLIPGPSQQAREYGRAQGWARSWQWDEDSIDDPKARPIPSHYQRKTTPRTELGWAVHAPTPSLNNRDDRYVAEDLAVPVRRRRIERTR